MTTQIDAAVRMPQQEPEPLPRGIGLPGRVAVTWATAGGLLVGGFLVAAMTLAGRLSGSGLLVTSAGLFVIGAALGFVHGGVLGWLGRPKEMSKRATAGALGRAALYALPAVTVGWIVAGWIAMTVVALYTGEVLPLVAAGGAWLVGIALVGWAGVEGWRAVRLAYARWPQARLGTALVAAAYGALLVLFLVDRPVVWGLELRVTEVGAVLLAGLVALWVVGPAVTAALTVAERLRVPALAPRTGTAGVAGTLALGVVVGLLLGLLALPFYGPPFGVPAAGAAAGVAGTAALAASQALLDEVLLRLVLVSGAAWALLRWYRVSHRGAALAAVVLAAAVQVGLYLPGALAIGFPSLLTTVGFLLVVVALPALAFGALYWTRGFGTAVLAHATALLAVALMAA